MSCVRRAIGIDIGGTKMAVAAVDDRGAIRARATIPTEAELGFARAVDRLGSVIDQVIQESQWQQDTLCGIGIGCAGPVDPTRGLINNPYTLGGWDQCDIVTPLRARFHRLPVFLENDADAAALGEYAVGAGRGLDPVVVLTFGTGVGGGVIVHGSIYRGVRGEHPELGHLSALPGGPKCYCGIAGCLESLASGTGIADAGRSLGFVDASAVFRAAVNGDPGALSIIERAVEATCLAAWTILHTFLPQRIVLGGGIMDEHYERFASAISARIEPATMVPRGCVSLARAQLGNDAGLVGAAALASSRAR